MTAHPTAAEIRAVNTRYHDVAASDYDAKWGIAFGGAGREQVVRKLHKALGPARAGPPFERALEIGAGTGYFSLNLVLAGIVRNAVCVDISPGMLAALRANATRLGLEVSTIVGDAERLPLPDRSFDLVYGHAVLHHLPDLEQAFGEFHRVLRAGGSVCFAGEPSRYGDRIAAVPKRAAGMIAPLWRRAIGAGLRSGSNGSAAEDHDHQLEFSVDVHAFAPADLARAVRAAGFTDVRLRGEELLASWFGWANRTLEATAEPHQIPWLWRQYAYRGYLAFQAIDRRLLEPRLPAAIFYNVMIAAQRPL